MKHLRSFFLAALAFTFVLPPLHASDLSITAASFVASPAAKKEIGKFGATITKGQLLYYDATAGTWKLADANVLAASFVGGIAGSDGVSGQDGVIITEDPDLTPGGTLDMSYPVYVLSATPGGIAVTNDLGAGSMYPVVVLVAKSTTKCIFKIALRGTAVTAAD